MRSQFFLLLLFIAFLLVPVVYAEDALEWTTKGQNAAVTGSYDVAIRYYDNALGLDPKYASALSGKAAALNALGNYADALKNADAALSIRESDPVALNARALALFGIGNYNDAVKAYDRLFTVQVNKGDAYCNQGYAYLVLEKYDNSVTAYDRCTALDPLNFMSWNRKGLAYMGSKKYDQALTSFDAATGITVKNATIWNNKGLAFVALNRSQDALQCFNKALGIDPNYADARANKESVMGKQQLFYYTGTITPVPTISRLGTLYTTATPTQMQTEIMATETAAPLETETPAGTVPIPKRTTYAPVSPVTVLGSVFLAGCAALCMKRK
jgi:tetratricopeptide (TPR) repeat protein